MLELLNYEVARISIGATGYGINIGTIDLLLGVAVLIYEISKIVKTISKSKNVEIKTEA